MATTFDELKTELRALIWPAGEPDNLVAVHDKAFIDGIIDLQRWVECLQLKNQSVFAFCATHFHCGKTVVEAPKGHIRKVWTISGTGFCDEVVYRHTTIHEVESWSKNILDYEQPTDNPILPPLPSGFRFSDASTDSTLGRARNGIFAIHRGRLYVAPWLQSNESLMVEWDGIKRTWNENDPANNDEDFKHALILFVKMSHERDYGDEKMFLQYKAEYEQMRADLIHECREETRVRKDERHPNAVMERGPSADELEADEIPTAEPDVTFAVIGDYGTGDEAEADVAELVTGWAPSFVVTLGDNWYGVDPFTLTTEADLDAVTGQFYSDFIYPYQGTYGDGATVTQKFFPVFGNRDRDPAARLGVEKIYFNQSRSYYDFVMGHVHFFVVDSGYDNSQVNQQADGVTATSVQADWLRAKLMISTARWKVVLFHHPPYSSTASALGSPLTGDGYLEYPALRWPFKDWGADIVLNGHGHNYERLEVDDLPYIIGGWSGRDVNDLAVFHATPRAYSVLRYRLDTGAIRATVNCNELKLEAINRAGTEVDELTLEKP